MTSIDASARHDLTDAQWALLEPLLPAPPVRGRPRRRLLRAMIDAVRWRTRVGAPRPGGGAPGPGAGPGGGRAPCTAPGG